MTDFDYPALRAHLGAMAPRFDVDCLPVCTSTSSELLQRAEAGAPSGSVVVADRQTAGRGRRGRVWLAPEGGSLAFSLLWRLAPDAKPPLGLSLAVGVAVAKALEGFGMAGVSLKWPNDILLAGRKLAGILIELAPVRGRGLAVVIGIGLNLRLPADFPDGPEIFATDLAAHLPGLPPREAVLAAVLTQLAEMLGAFDVAGFPALRDDWMLRHAHQDQAVRLLDEHRPAVEGICRGADVDGALLLETPEGLTRILAGEVSLRPA